MLETLLLEGARVEKRDLINTSSKDRIRYRMRINIVARTTPVGVRTSHVALEIADRHIGNIRRARHVAHAGDYLQIAPGRAHGGRPANI